MWQRYACGIRHHIVVWRIFDSYVVRCGREGCRGQASKALDFRIGGVERRLLWRLFLLGVRLVGIFALFDCPDDPGGIPLCVLDLLLCFLVWRAPYVDEVEEGSGRVESHGCLLRDLVGLDHPFCSIQRLLGELLDVCLARCVVGDGIL